MKPIDPKAVQMLRSSEPMMDWRCEIKETISLRVDRIVRSMADLLGVKVEWWDFDNAPADLDDGQGEFDESFYVSAVGFIGEFIKDGERVVFLNTRTFSRNSLPIERLYMEDEKWQAECMVSMRVGHTTEGMETLNDEAKRKNYARRRQDIRNAICSKLTPEEMEHIIFKF